MMNVKTINGMKRKFTQLVYCFALLLCTATAAATNRYVSALIGSDANDGLTPATPKQTLAWFSWSTTRLLAGDTLFVMDGTYTSASSNVLTLICAGTPANPIVITKYPGHNPLIVCGDANWNAIQLLQGAHDIVIDGLSMRGNNANLNLADALAQPGGCSGTPGPVIAKFNGNGIGLDGRFTGPNGKHPYNIVIRNCTIYEFPGGGVACTEADYVTVENCTIYNNCWYTLYSTSGVSFFHCYNSDLNTTDFKMIARNNIIYGNELFVPAPNFGCVPLDGNGIIVDDGRNTQASSSIQGQVYLGKTLVENNVVYRNGGRGINVYLSDNVTIRNNTTYANQRTSGINDGELALNSAGNIRATNNVFFARTGKRLTGTFNTVTNFYENNNLMYNNGVFSFFNGRDIMANPQFVDTAANDFRLLPTSPGIDAGNDTAGNYTVKDILNVNRPFRTLPDVGAYEYTGTLPVRTTFTKGNLAILRVGDGATAVSTAALPVTILEFTTAGVPTGTSVSLSGGSPNFVLGGSTANNVNEGQLLLSADGRYLSAVGYNAAVGTAEGAAGTGMRGSEKRIARIDYALEVDTTTRIPSASAFNGFAVRSATTDFGASYWVAATTAYRTINHSAATSNAVGGAVSARTVNRVNGRTYHINFNTVSINNGTTSTDFPGTNTGGGSQSVLLFNADAAVDYAGTGFDLLYRTEVDGGIRKFYFNGTTWVDAGLYNPAAIGASGFTAFTGFINSDGKPELYAIKGLGANNLLVKLVDNSARITNWATATGAEVPSASLLAQAGANYIFRGVAFTPTRYGTTPPQTIVTLPVKISSLQGYLVQNDAFIQWSTSAEDNVKEFVVERSSDGKTFVPIGSVAASNRGFGAQYSYADKNLSEGWFFYQLKTIDNDGRFSLSKVVIVRNVKMAKGELRLFPNPAVDKLVLSYSALRQDAVVSIVDLGGRALKRQNVAAGSRQVTVDVSTLRKGQYSVVIYAAEGVLVSKFVK